MLCQLIASVMERDHGKAGYPFHAKPGMGQKPQQLTRTGTVSFVLPCSADLRASIHTSLDFHFCKIASTSCGEAEIYLLQSPSFPCG